MPQMQAHVPMPTSEHQVPAGDTHVKREARLRAWQWQRRRRLASFSDFNFFLYSTQLYRQNLSKHNRELTKASDYPIKYNNLSGTEAHINFPLAHWGAFRNCWGCVVVQPTSVLEVQIMAMDLIDLPWIARVLGWPSPSSPRLQHPDVSSCRKGRHWRGGRCSAQILGSTADSKSPVICGWTRHY